ncbi:MAG: 1-deoxy-D-xylulose-5-phosphate reductoisomerase [Myxococcota bacterium]
MKRLSLLGSTGSIGRQVLERVERFPDRLEVVALAAGRNIELLIQQAKQLRPRLVSVERPADVARVREALGNPAIEVLTGEAGLCAVASEPVDLLVGALVGRVGLEPTLAALGCGADVALANKEVLVVAGELVLGAAARSGAKIVPLDSEHVAIHQCLQGHEPRALRRVLLTASGGPFRSASDAEIATATPEQALAHPNWSMGRKITIDSATLMNKGFEIIEARWLFDLEPEQIGAVIHPESIVHALVEFWDGSWLAQLGVPDMRSPLAYTLGMPERLPLPDLEPLNLVKLGALHFEPPDPERFPALRLAAEVLRTGGTAPAILNAANEVAVEAFLERRIPFNGIVHTAEGVLEAEPAGPALGLEEIGEADRRARERAGTWIGVHYG